MNLTSVLLEGSRAAGESLDIEVGLNHAEKVATLFMLEFDDALVTAFLAGGLPSDFGVRVDDMLFEQVADLPRYDLVISLAGRRHPTRLLRLPDGQVTLRLGDPDAAYLACCQIAIDQVLEALAEQDIDAVVQGMDRYGRPRPREGFLHLFAATSSNQQEEQVLAISRGIGEACGVDLIALGFRIDRTIELDPHFAWDSSTSSVVRRNWEPR